MASLKREKHLLLNLLAKSGITDRQVLKVLAKVPRELFVPPHAKAETYANRPLIIGHGQTISQPFIVALMTQELKLTPTDAVLEIGTGSGYQTAILAKLAKAVYTIERIKPLQDKAKIALKKLKITNVHFKLGDGWQGWPRYAPYQAILVTAAAPSPPAALLNQLDLGGRMIIPEGDFHQHLLRYTKGEVGTKIEDLGEVSFVPLVKGLK